LSISLSLSLSLSLSVSVSVSLSLSVSLDADEDEVVGDDNIWDEPEDSDDNIVIVDSNQVKLGKLNKLIERLTSPTVHGMCVDRTQVQ
jgi:hypothetical protein